jgi:hypothetical protein
MPLTRERVAYLSEPWSGPTGHALALRHLLRLFSGEGLELEKLGFVFLECCPVGLLATRRNTDKQLAQTRKSTKDQLAQAQDSINDQLAQARESQAETARLTEQGQITERFTRAIEQLGASDDDGKKRLEVRLGGIYALERTAVDSLAMKISPGRDYATIMEVLTAYVRENAPRLPTQQKPSADIQAILDVLGRREVNNVPEKYRVYLDLSRTDLSGAVFGSGTRLTKANFQNTNFLESNLADAKFWFAELHGATLVRANLQGAVLAHAELPGTWLYGADLRGADLAGVDLRDSDHFLADLRGAKLCLAKIDQERLEQAIGDESTELPQGRTRPAFWSEPVQSQVIRLKALEQELTKQKSSEDAQ